MPPLLLIMVEVEVEGEGVLQVLLKQMGLFILLKGMLGTVGTTALLSELQPKERKLGQDSILRLSILRTSSVQLVLFLSRSHPLDQCHLPPPHLSPLQLRLPPPRVLLHPQQLACLFLHLKAQARLLLFRHRRQAVSPVA